MLFFFLNFLALVLTNFLSGTKATPSNLSENGQMIVLASFVIVSLIFTYMAVKQIAHTEAVKEKYGYKFDETDTRFDSTKDVVKLAFFCGIAAVLCGCTGIAGGMVLGPLFLTYGMLPSIMSATNQYISMIAAFSVVLQFVYAGTLDLHHAVIFGGISCVACFIGIV